MEKAPKGPAIDNHTGFFLPDGSSLSQDGGYVTEDQLRGLTHKDRAHFLHRKVPIYEPGKPSRVEGGEKVVGTGPVERVVLELDPVWECYEDRD